MTDIVITIALNEARLVGTLAFLNTGPGFARARIYGNDRPPSVYDAPGAPHLVEIPLDDPAGEVTANQLHLNAGPPGLIVNTGVAVWARFVNGDGVTGFDCDVSDEAGTATVRLPQLQLYAGGLAALLPSTLG